MFEQISRMALLLTLDKQMLAEKMHLKWIVHSTNEKRKKRNLYQFYQYQFPRVRNLQLAETVVHIGSVI